MQNNIKFSTQTNLLVLEETETSSSNNLSSSKPTTSEQFVTVTVTEQLPIQTLKPSTKGTNKKKVWVLLLILAVLTIAYWKSREIKDLAGNLFSAVKKSASQTKPEREILYWQDPMHPAYKSNKPGQAPDCGMDLVPVYKEESAKTNTNLPVGAFKISPEKQQLIGVQYGEVSYQTISKTLRTVGRITYDETKISHVHTKIDGWIEEVYVDFTGKQIEKGQPLISIYSPDLVQTQQEYLLALRAKQELGDSSFPEAARGVGSLYESARRRLELWDITPEQIKELEERGQPIKALTLYSPASGFVLTRNAFQKQRIMPDTDLYSIADLSTVWVIADIYEFEASEIKLGQKAIITLPYNAGKSFSSIITYIYPQLDNTTRTLKVRMEIPNPEMGFKPDMYANVEIKIDYGKQLVVPQEAILDSGLEQRVFVALAEGYFQPRTVKLGDKLDNKVAIISGLKAGERVVTSANFLVDSESQLKMAVGGMEQHNHGGIAPSKTDTTRDTKTPKPSQHSQH
ncbi:MAG: efflux RND transporter periplasmic adaptor subunit [Blastocatellia bacterium]